MKHCTTLKQSNRLLKLGLDPATADFVIFNNVGQSGEIDGTNTQTVPKELLNPLADMTNAVPCWSLAALFYVIPQEIFDGEYIINITEGCDNRWVLTYDHYENRNHSYYGLSTGSDNLIDACTDIIIKLKERNII